MRYILILFTLLFSSYSFSAPTTGGFTADAVVAMKPELITDTSGIRYWDVLAQRAGTLGLAKIPEDYAVGRVLAASRAGTIGLAGLAAVEAAKGVAGMCIWQTDKWHDCTQRPVIPITIDTSKIIPASPPSTTQACIAAFKAVPANIQYNRQFVSVSQDSGAGFCVVMYGYGGAEAYPQNVWYTVPTSYSCSSGSLVNSSGVPMPLTGQYCASSDAYSCPSNYFRSDSSGNSDSGGVFCSYSSPVYDDTQAAKLLAPYLLDYYANQLFTGKDGKSLDVFSAPNTTFDPTASPSTMPMTLDQLKQYVDWVRNGTAQTTDPLAPHYISPNNYNYTKNYINNSNSTTTINNTSSASPTITPEQAASSAAMTQSQYEASNKKTYDAEKAAINSVDTSTMDDYRTSSGFDGNQGDLDSKITDIGNMASPVVNPTLDLPRGGSCRQIPISFSAFGHQYSTLLPTDEWCVQLQKLKQAMAYLMYILTAVGIVYELIRRPVEGN